MTTAARGFFVRQALRRLLMALALPGSVPAPATIGGKLHMLLLTPN